MKFIGEYSKDSKIILEIVIKNKNNQPLNLDLLPTATIFYDSSDSKIMLSSVTLLSVEEGIYANEFIIPNMFQKGRYIIEYSFAVNSQTHKKYSYFMLNDQENDNEDSDTILENQESIGKIIDYILPPEFQINADIQVDQNKIIITPEEVKSNYNYTVVLTKDIKSLSGYSLETDQVIEWTTEYQPLYVSPLEVRSVLKDLFKYFSIREIYESIRNAGQEAHQLLRMSANPHSTDFELLTDDDNNYYAVTRFVLYESSSILLNSLLIQLLNMKESELDNIGGFKLGDFEVDTSSNSSSGNNESNESIDIMIQELLSKINGKIKFWKDAMFNRNARGYATPVQAVYKGGVVAPESRDF